jgi:predicted nucleotidyltransferase
MPPPLPPHDRLRHAAAEVAETAGARLVALFGSAARGEPTAHDLDIGVLADEPVDTVALTNAFIRRLSFQDVDVTDLRRADPVLLALAARDGVPLYERAPGEFARFVSLAARRFADTDKFRRAQRALPRA